MIMVNSCPKCPKFCTFLPTFFWAGSPKFWDLDYKTEPTSDHVAKFQGNQPKESSKISRKNLKKKTKAVKHKTVGLKKQERNKEQKILKPPNVYIPIPQINYKAIIAATSLPFVSPFSDHSTVTLCVLWLMLLTTAA